MLNKEVCKQCIINHTRGSITDTWKKDDEERWNEGKVWCYVDVMEMKSIYGDIPKNCYYPIEQLILGSK